MSFFGTGDRLEWFSAPEADAQAGTAYNLNDLSTYFSDDKHNMNRCNFTNFKPTDGKRNVV